MKWTIIRRRPVIGDVEVSGCVPRGINRFCDLALLVGYADELPILTAEKMEAVGEEVNIGLTV